MEITPEVFKENGFIEDGIGLYHPPYYNIRFHQLFAPDDTTLIDCFVVTIDDQLQLNGDDAIEFDTLEQVKTFYSQLNITDIWK
jgi:hypothetical protein